MAALPPGEATRLLGERAVSLGFDWFGIAPSERLEAEESNLRAWLSEGRHGEMAWMARDPERRANPALVLDGCKSVVIFGLNYLRGPVEESLPPRGYGRVSKYARARDYHRVIEKRLRKLARYIDEELSPGAASRSFVDYGPVMERPWAARGGIGFLGKHTLLIHPKEGSFHFLGSLLTTAELAPTEMADALRPSDCGDCRRCIDACPTGAITEPWKLDARRCLSYLTIEKEGEIAEEFHGQFRGNVFGCDICQDVCPYNRSRAAPAGDDSAMAPELVPADVPLATLIRDAQGFLELLGNVSSPLRRAGTDSLRRNAVIAAAENGNEESLKALETLAQEEAAPAWTRDLARSSAEKLRASLARE